MSVTEDVSDTSPTEDTQDLLERFVGEVDLPEGALPSFHPPWHNPLYSRICPSDQEPLLTETKRRFVLFPIQYNEVCNVRLTWHTPV